MQRFVREFPDLIIPSFSYSMLSTTADLSLRSNIVEQERIQQDCQERGVKSIEYPSMAWENGA